MRTIVLLLALILVRTSQVIAQPSNTVPIPNDPPVGIGTQLSSPSGPLNALHIHYDSSIHKTMQAIARFSEGAGTNVLTYGILGIVPQGDPTFSTIASGKDFILHEHQDGDIILANWSPVNVTHTLGGAIRFSTTGDTLVRPITFTGHHDLERLTVLGNGNIGIDLPPDSITGLGKPMDQLQIGGGAIAGPGNPLPLPGLTIYGGNRFEGMLKPGGGSFPVDWRTLAFNHFEDRVTGVASRFQPLASSLIGFGEVAGGHVTLESMPFSPGQAMTDFRHGVTLELTGSKGLEMWTDEGDSGLGQYHHLFDVWRPGFGGGSSIRNTNGIFLHHTPVYIGNDGNAADITDLANVHPASGDGKTWLLAVNGPVLAKEFFVSLDWPDFVFDSSYVLLPLEGVERYVKENNHLPGLPSVREVEKNGIPLGKTEAKLLQKIEELTLYSIELSKKNAELDRKLQKLDSEIQDLREKKEAK